MKLLVTSCLLLLSWAICAQSPCASGASPQANFDYSISPDGQVTFTNKSTKSTEYLWTLEENTYSTLEHPVHLFKFGTYEIRLSATSECGSSEIAKTIFVITGLSKDNRVYNFYPNPTEDIVNIFSRISGRLKIIDSAGQLRSDQVIPMGAHILDLNSYQDGTYYLVLETDDDQTIKQLIKQ